MSQSKTPLWDTLQADENYLTSPIKVLDKGFVRLIDFMGDDSRIVAAARCSYGKGTKTVREDAKLIDYMFAHGHSSVFEQVVFTFHVKLPIFVARQIVRHRTARLNELSGRYSEIPEEFYIPELEQVCCQDKKNKQGSAEPLSHPLAVDFVQSHIEACTKAYATYKNALALGVSRETARMMLPLATYTEWYWQMDLSNLFKFLKLRMDAHAQWETRQYANAKASIVKQVVPMAYAAFEKHVLGETPAT